MPMGGVPIEIGDPGNCELDHDESLISFTSEVLPIILTTCTAMCHSSTGTRTYKYSFDAMTVDELNDDQIQEALLKTSEYIEFGKSAESQIISLLLYDHPTLGIMPNQPIYTSLVDWIDGIPLCP
jgi:hypothetical protein